MNKCVFTQLCLQRLAGVYRYSEGVSEEVQPQLHCEAVTLCIWKLAGKYRNPVIGKQRSLQWP